ncbi:hypothetical protein VOLCADRAFT_90923 [Volvox carteri f. nagariensis]|uniref:Uncharacterized protein n=1 Tax=Volvox carteri f. nagariensis TaxID=3068 RepID=D8TVQ9_VOLCA|nr:uncharacterized protein VOLCADRAFT_90923 [Volvox carteri f. nagariensis]EFJ48346.1 hypothetical protein VOLCADRAFT_90923 [Volvox carteri f. nagariensis]|eukprot:XP_002950600.1 hypothetical protein VOLCADRAFT_90923 [Volvox carteri f. nagariensis]
MCVPISNQRNPTVPSRRSNDCYYCTRTATVVLSACFTILSLVVVVAPPGSLAATVCQQYPGYISKPDVDRYGDDIGNFGANALATCNSNPSCKAFNTAGWVKRSATPQTAAPGSCLYVKVCEQYAGYTSIPNVDRYGDDIGNFGANALAQCSGDPSCKAFNTAGWVKRSATPQTAAPGSCLYVKKATVCQQYYGYISKPDVDRYGDDIGNFGANALATCNSNPSCKAFNTAGWVKRSATPQTAALGSCLYVKVCEQYAGYTSIPNVDRYGDDIGNFGANALAQCSGDPSCKAFNTAGWVKRSATPQTAAPGSCLYVKKVTVCQQYPGYTSKPDVDRYGDDIGNFGANALATCNSNPSCKAFNTAGWVKRSATPQTAALGSCLYVKSSWSLTIFALWKRPSKFWTDRTVQYQWPVRTAAEPWLTADLLKRTSNRSNARLRRERKPRLAGCRSMDRIALAPSNLLVLHSLTLGLTTASSSLTGANPARSLTGAFGASGFIPH